MQYKIIDQFCGQADTLFQHCLKEWLWEYCPTKTNRSENKFNYQMFHNLFSPKIYFPSQRPLAMGYPRERGYSKMWSDIDPIVNAIDNHTEVATFRRVKANLQLVQPERVFSDFHQDYHNGEGTADTNMWVGLYYLNTNDGYTEFEDGTIVNSVADRMVFFNNEYKHRGVSQLDKKERLVINFNFYCPIWTNPI